MGIAILDDATINQIAAGEVVERPASVVKELVENAIDAGATAITVEIKEGGVALIRITDNGQGISKEEVPIAFLRHATSKIREVTDLFTTDSFGFRGEALASIASVSQVELITKTKDKLTGTRYIIEGGVEKEIEEIGCPDGTTFLMRNLFFNTPARKKFLKSSTTEGSYVSALIERIAISNPNVSFKFILNGQIKLQTAGNGNIKDIIYQVYGRDVTNEIIPVDFEKDGISLRGFIGKPVISRGNRNYMNYYVNGRYVKNSVVNQAIEEAYRPYMMLHRYPFTALMIEVDKKEVDVNVHPAKQEVRFHNRQEVFDGIYHCIKDVLAQKDMFVHSTFHSAKPDSIKAETAKVMTENKDIENATGKEVEPVSHIIPEPFEVHRREEVLKEETVFEVEEKPVQMQLFEKDGWLKKETIKSQKIIGQVFSTYWIVEFEGQMYIIDQHAAHEKVLYEKTMKLLKEQKTASQLLEPPMILTLNLQEEQALNANLGYLEKLGFEIDPFGGKEYAIRGVPANLTNVGEKELFMELLDDLVSMDTKRDPEILLDRVATMSCKAAVKGNNNLSYQEAEELIRQLLSLENPFHCPHGRPTIITMSKYELDRKFKRIL